MQWAIIIPSVVLVLLIIFALAIKRWKSGGDSMSAWNGGDDGGLMGDEENTREQVLIKPH